MTKKQERTLRAVLRCEGHCFRHSHQCSDCPIEMHCGSTYCERINQAAIRTALAKEALIQLEIDGMLARKYD